MSQYNKTVLTQAGLALAKRANAGLAKFGITRAVTSADDWSKKTVQDLEEVTTIPNIMQQGTIMDTDEVESNNSVIGVSLGFTNKNLRTGYQIRIIGLYVKEEGQENDFLYAVTTAVTPEYMPSFADKVLYRFNMQMYLVIGNAQSVNVVINDGTAVTHGQLNKYKAEVTENLKKLENTHKEDMSHVAKSASVNGGAEILPDSTGKLNLVVPDPDLSKYVSLEQLGELLKAKANAADVYTKKETDLRLAQAGKVKSVNGNLPDQDGDVHVPSYAPNLLLGTQSKPKTVEMASWSANADTYSIDPSIDLSGQKVTASIKLAKSTNDAMVVLEYTDSTGAWHFPWGTIVPAGTTGYSTVTQVLPANVKNIGVRPSWTNGNTKGTCTYSEAKLTVWKSASLPPDMTWLPNEADKANTSDVNDLRNQVQQLKDNQFEVQTFTDATAAASWEAQRPGKRMAIVNQ